VYSVKLVHLTGEMLWTSLAVNNYVTVTIDCRLDVKRSPRLELSYRFTCWIYSKWL